MKLSNSDRHEIMKSLKEARDRKLETLAPGWKENVDKEARKRAIGKLKIADLLIKRDELTKDIEELEQQKLKLQRRIDDKMPQEEHTRHRGYCPGRMNVCDAVRDLEKEYWPKAAKSDAEGKKYLKIQEEFTKKQNTLFQCSTREEIKESKILE